MIAGIVVAHSDRLYSDDLIAALAAIGLTDVAYFSDVMMALDLLSHLERIELLISQIDFGPGKLHGIALARMAKTRLNKVNVILLGEEEHRSFVDGAGELLPLATAPATLAAHVHELVICPRGIT